MACERKYAREQKFGEVRRRMQAPVAPQGPPRSAPQGQQVDLDALVRNASLLTPDLVAILSELTSDGALTKTSDLAQQVNKHAME
jgi:hypothetical protein